MGATYGNVSENLREDSMQTTIRPLALVTGASTGIGYELAKKCAEQGFDLVVVADEPQILDAAGAFRLFGVEVQAVQADLATLEGVDRVQVAAAGIAPQGALAEMHRRQAEPGSASTSKQSSN